MEEFEYPIQCPDHLFLFNHNTFASVSEQVFSMNEPNKLCFMLAPLSVRCVQNCCCMYCVVLKINYFELNTRLLIKA